MASRFDVMVRRLGQLNMQIRREMELAEAKVLRVNRLVRQLSQTGLLKKITILGQCSRSFRDTDDERSDSWRVVLPVLLTPEGFGVCVCDTEKAYKANQEGLSKSEARRKFVPFDQCEPADKTFLLSFIEPMLDELMDVASVAAGDLVHGSPVKVSEYFRTRKRKRY